MKDGVASSDTVLLFLGQRHGLAYCPSTFGKNNGVIGMRNLNIASKPLSKALSLELEILTERAKIKQLPHEAQEALLLRIRNGDATAILLLVDSWQIIVLSVVRQYLYEKVRVAELVAAGKEALTRLAKSELNATGREHFFRFGIHHIRTTIQTMLQNRRQKKIYEETFDTTNGSTLSLQAVLADIVPFLNHLNKTLHQIEKYLIGRAKTLLITAQKNMDATMHFSSDYEVEATIEYYLNEREEPAHTAWFPFTYKEVVLKKEYGMLQGDSDGFEWSQESYMPLLDKPYCYLLHDLIDHSQPRLHYSLSTLTGIWVDMVYTDQQHIKIEKDGSGTVVRWDER